MTSYDSDPLWPVRRVQVPISWKLLAATVVVGVVAAGIAIFGLQRMHLLNERLTKTVDYSAEKVKLAAVLKQDLVAITRAEKNLILASSDEEMQRYAATIDQTLSSMSEHEQRLRDLVDREDKQQLDTFAQKWQQWQKNHRDVRNFAELNSDVHARQLALGKGRELFARFERALTAVADQAELEFQTARAAGSLEELDRLGNKMTLVARLLGDAARIQQAEKQVILAPNEQEMEQYETAFEPLQDQIKSHFEALDQWAEAQGEQPLREARQAFHAYADTLTEIRAFLGQKGNFFVRQFAYEIGGPLAAECEQLLDAISAKNEADMQAYQRESQATFRAARNTLLGFSAVGIVISVAVTYVTGQRIARNLSRLADYAQQVQITGDLSTPVPRVSRDEVGMLAEAFDHMRQSLHRQTTQLAALNKALEHKNEEMEQFVYTASHDLSSPLVSFKGLIGLIQEDIAEGNYNEVAVSTKKLDQAADQLRYIIDDLLALSRIGRKPLDLTEVDVQLLVSELKEELASRLKAVGAELQIQNPLPAVTADAKDVKRVFENLLTNAIKYACEGSQSLITVGGMSTGKEVRYFVCDNGPGIEPQYHEKIFGLFQRLDTEKPGTGLGLASVAKIMRMHGGRAWVESADGQGAKFWIAFPSRPQ